MNYDICLDMASIFILLTALVGSAVNKRNSSFRVMLIALIAALLLDIAGALLINSSDTVNIMFNMALNALAFISLSVVVFLYSLYMTALLDDEKITRNSLVFTVPVLALDVCMHICNVFLGFMFYFNENNEYSHGKLYFLIHLFPVYFFTYAALVLIKHYRETEKRKFFAVMSLAPFAVIGTVLQITVMSNHLVVLFAFTLALMMVFFNIESPDQKKLEAALIEADNANHSKSNFLANMSHEIRTPMNVIVGMCELILREKDINDAVRDYCFNIQNSGRNLLAIINDILDFSKIESGKMEIVEDEFNIASILNDAINMAVTRKGSKELEIIVHVQTDIPSVLIGDEVRIRQIITNIVSNAVKYTREGGIFIRVSASQRDYGINLSVSVSDTGIGITEENLGKIFNSFQQVDTKKNRAVEGTGLGLAISKLLLTRMGGFINVSSVYGKGSEFRFVLPVKVKEPEPFISVKESEKIHAAGFIDFGKFGFAEVAAHYRMLAKELADGLNIGIDVFGSADELKAALEAPESDYTHVFAAREEFSANEKFFLKCAENFEFILIQDRAEPLDVPENARCIFKPFYALSAAALFNCERIATNAAARKSENVHFCAPNAKILIVDDNPINLKVAAGLMRPYKMQVITADNAGKAIDLLRSKDFHIVFMDHMMPGTDGVEATALIRSMNDEYYKNVPIIALTANAVNGAKHVFLEAGMNDFLAKPIELGALDRILRTWLPKELTEAPSAGDTAAPVKSIQAVPDESNKLFSVQTGLFYAGGDAENYMEILEMYVRKGAENLRYIQKLFDEKSWKNFIIEVHALKSSSLTIGSKQLSELAKELEFAGKAEDYELISRKLPELTVLYGQVLDRGREYLAKNKKNDPEEKTVLTEITAEKADEFIQKILAACSEFDADKIAAICISSYDYSCGGIPMKELLGKAEVFAQDFEYEAAEAEARAAAEKLKGGE